MESTYASRKDEKQRVPGSTRVYRSSARLGSVQQQTTAPIRTSIVLRARRHHRLWQKTEDDPLDNANRTNAVVLDTTSSGQTRRSVQAYRIARKDKNSRRKEKGERKKVERISEDSQTEVQQDNREDSPDRILWERLEEDLQEPAVKKEKKVHIVEDTSDKETEAEQQQQQQQQQKVEEYTEKIRERRGRKARAGEDNPSDRIEKKVSNDDKTREIKHFKKEEDSLENVAGTGVRTLLSRRPGKPKRSSAGRRCPASSSTSSSSSSVARKNPMTMDLQRLIDEVQARPAIWDQRNVNYHNREVIFKMWREIARACDVSTEVAKSKWKHLRDNFRNELKKTYRSKCEGGVIMGGVGGNITPNEHDSKWVWFNSLFFLREQMNSRVIGCGLPQNCNAGIHSSPDETQIEPQIDIVEGHSQAHFDEDIDGDGSCQSMLSNDDGLRRGMLPPKPSKLGRKRTLLETIDEDYMEVERKRYESMQKRLVADQLDKDDTYHFLMSVRNPIKSLPLDRQMFIRLKIQELVYNEINSQNHHNIDYDLTDVKPPIPAGNNNTANDDISPIEIRNSMQENNNSENAFIG